MNILRLLLLLAAAWLVWRVVRQVRAQLTRRDPTPPADAYEPMARCTECGTYLPVKSLNSAGLCGRCGE